MPGPYSNGKLTMLILDPRTIYLTGAAFVAIGAIHLLILAYRLPFEYRASAKAWAIGCISASVSWLFFALDDLLPDISTILFGNLAYLLGTVLLYQSVRHFDGLRPQHHLYYTLVAPTISLNLACRYLIDSFETRVVLMSLAMAVPLFLAARQLLVGSNGPGHGTGRRTTAGWMLTCAGILFLRAVATPLGASFETLVATPAQGVVLATSLLTVTALVFSYYLLYFDRSTFELRHQAERDPLTGLLNRRAFSALAEREIQLAHECREPLSLLLIDANDFKRINDERGHDAGDETLRHIANTLLQNLRQKDAVARLGGDEFAVCLPGLSEDQARSLAWRLVERLGVSEDGVSGVSVSVGVSALHPLLPNLPALLRDADEALYKEKRKRTLIRAPVSAPLRCMG